MSLAIDFPNNWICDGRELKPKSGASSSNTWIFDGKEIKPKSGASSSNTWLWDGKELKPKNSASSSNTWVVEGQKIKPKNGASSSKWSEFIQYLRHGCFVHSGGGGEACFTTLLVRISGRTLIATGI